MICPFMSKPVVFQKDDSNEYDYEHSQLEDVDCRGQDCALWCGEACCFQVIAAALVVEKQ